MKHGEAHLTKGAVGKNSLTKLTQFHIWSIKTGAPSMPATYHMKDFNTTHFGDVQDEYNEVLSISDKNTKVLMIGNGHVINFTGDINAPQMQALVGMAVRKNLLNYREKDGHDLLLSQDHKPEVSLALNRNGTKNNQSKAAHVEKSEPKCSKQGKAKINFDGSFVRAFPLCHEQKLDSKKGEVDWQSYRLIGEVALSIHNQF